MADRELRLEDLFAELRRRDDAFASYEELERAVEQLLNQHVRDLPTGYSVRDAVIWARRCGWVEVRDHRLRLTTDAARSAA